MGDAFSPSAALLKATLILSGTAMENEPGFPSNNQGWGRITLDSALFFEGDSEQVFALDSKGGLQTGESLSQNAELASGQTLKAVLVWTDYPSTPQASTNLVNDLNLTVTGPSGTFLGNVFDQGSSIPGGQADSLNNVELVLLKDAMPGTYQLQVSGFNIPEGPQPFALMLRVETPPQEVELLYEADLSQSTGQDVYYSVEVPAGALSLGVETKGDNGDADLYLRYGALPSTSVFDAKSISGDSNESIIMPTPQEGSWLILIHAYAEFSNLDLRVWVTLPPNTCRRYADLFYYWPEQGVSILTLIQAMDCP